MVYTFLYLYYNISLRAKSRALYSYYDNEKKSLKGA